MYEISWPTTAAILTVVFMIVVVFLRADPLQKEQGWIRWSSGRGEPRRIS
jgi:hypothetical protein